MLEPSKFDPVVTIGMFELLNDFDDRRNRLACLTKELKADGTAVAWHTMHHPARGGDESVATLFLYARQTA